MHMETKAFPTEYKVLDAKQGIVECYANRMGVLDYAGEIMAPGAFDASVAAKGGSLPKSVWMHESSLPVGKVLETHQAEQGGDPMQYCKIQFNLDTQRGREAFSDVAGGYVDEWSVGYYVTAEHPQFIDGQKVRVLDAIDWIEVSPVLAGASPGTSTLSAKQRRAAKAAKPAFPGALCPFCHPKAKPGSNDEDDCTCSKDCGEDGCPAAEKGKARTASRGRKDAPEGSAEDTAQDLVRALTEGDAPAFPNAIVQVVATFPNGDHGLVWIDVWGGVGADTRFIVPYAIGPDGEPVPGDPLPAELVYLPTEQDDAAQLGLPMASAIPYGGGQAADAADSYGMSARGTPEQRAAWNASYINDLPDSAFAWIDKDAVTGKDANGSIPKSARYLPHHDADGSVDLPHLRNALAREPQADIPAAGHKAAADHLNAHAKAEKIGDYADDGKALATHVAASTKAGARNSATDKGHIQDAHDALLKTGAVDCDPGNVPNAKLGPGKAIAAAIERGDLSGAIAMLSRTSAEDFAAVTQDAGSAVAEAAALVRQHELELRQRALALELEEG